MATSKGITPQEQSIADTLIRERRGTPERVLKELKRVRPVLKQLVDEKVPMKDILNRFIKGGLETRVTASQAREYIKQQFDYPPTREPRKKKTGNATKKVTKKAVKTRAR